MRVFVLLFAFALFIALILWPGPEVERGPGVLVPEEPEQTLIARPEPWQAKGYRVTPLATYRIRARVLLTDWYWMGREADLSPIDLTVGWRLMSNRTVLDGLRLYRGHRMFYWAPVNGVWPARHEDITAHAANMHMIPGNAEVAERLKGIRRGDLIDAGGFLVEVAAPDGWRWRSSLSRTDEGEGACELMWAVTLNTF
jgi:hypothetical protein